MAGLASWARALRSVDDSGSSSQRLHVVSSVGGEAVSKPKRAAKVYNDPGGLQPAHVSPALFIALHLESLFCKAASCWLGN